MSTEGPPPVPPSPYEPPRTSGYVPPPMPPKDGPRLPWELRDQLGIGPALVATIQLLVTDPAEAFSRLRRDGDLGSPILFAVILGWVGALLGQMWSYLFNASIRSLFSGARGIDTFFPETSVIVIVGILILMPIFIVAGLLLGAGLFHLCLLMVGATSESPTGFEGTLKVCAYAQVATLAAIIPMMGSAVTMGWALVLDGVGFVKVHETTPAKSAGAVLIPIALSCFCVIFFIAAFTAISGRLLTGAGS